MSSPKPTFVVLGALMAVGCSSGSSGSNAPATATDAGSDAAAEVPADGGAADGGAADAAAGDTWETYGRAFFKTYCVECHATGNARRDYTLLADVKRDRDEIRCGVAATKGQQCSSFPPPKQFPIDNAGGNNAKPSDTERARLVAWIEAGTP